MPCYTVKVEGQTLAQRQDQVKQALKRLELYLASNRVTVQVGQNGAITFKNWNDRNDVTDVCAFRTLTAQGSSALRMAVVRAEGLAGRKVNLQAVAAGVHSHDGGKTWNPGH